MIIFTIGNLFDPNTFKLCWIMTAEESQKSLECVADVNSRKE
jgi:hypothetical protein